MSHYKLLSVVGARPQFIKLAAMHRAIAKTPTLKHVIVHSGQHYDFEMSGQFFEELSIPKPDYNLEIGSGHHITQMTRCMSGLTEILEKEKPDMVLVYGDTNTTAAAAICAAKCNFKLAHIEAGLREWDKRIPEEINKLLTDAVTDLFFTPTETGRMNLENEGKIKNVYVTGDISLDLLSESSEQSTASQSEPYIYTTCHRAANTENKENLKNILDALSNFDTKIIFSMHPRTAKAIVDFGLQAYLDKSHIEVIPPCGFRQSQEYIRNADFVITDSGGVIKEAYFYKTPCVIIDKQTEWLEALNEGWAMVSGPDKIKIMEVIKNWQQPKIHTQALGDGKSGMRIAGYILKYLNELHKKNFGSCSPHG